MKSVEKGLLAGEDRFRITAKPLTVDFRSMAQASEYQKRQDGNSSVFTVTPAVAPKFIWMLVLGGISGLLGLVTLPCGLAFLAIAAGAIWFGWSYDPRPKAHKQPSSFRVSAGTIEVNGQTFKKEDIHRLIIKNGISNEVLTGPTVLVPVSGSMAQGMMQRAKVAALANGLELETGGKAYLLAGGMDATTAFGLLTDVSKVIGFKTT